MGDMKFTKAVRRKSKLKIAISGPSGSGKTYSSLLIAKGLGGKVGVICTERGSASLYDTLLDFYILQLDPPYTPERYIEAIHTAESAGIDDLVIDSLTHEWNGSGGCLEANQILAEAKYRGNTWSAWNETTPRHQKFIDAILQSPMHIIGTMRSKTETAQEGRKVIKLGMKNEQRDGMDYEFTVVFELVHDSHNAMATKDRMLPKVFTEPHVISEETGKKFLQWLDGGAEALPDLCLVLKKSLNDCPTLDALNELKGQLSLAKAKLSAGEVSSLALLFADTKKRLENAPMDAMKEAAGRILDAS